MWYTDLKGINEAERKQRKRANALTTKINFFAWVIEVMMLHLRWKPTWKIFTGLLIGIIFSFLHSSCLLPRRLHLWVCGQSSGEPRLPSASPPSMQLLLRGRPWLKPWRISRSPNAALTTPALSGQLKDELSKHIWNFTREWHQRVTPESGTREWHLRVTPESDTRE